MYFNLIESLDAERTVEVAARTFPAIAILEDQDGVRLLLVDSDAITSRVWLKASMAGIAAIIRPDGAQWACLSVDAFLDGRSEDLQRGVYVAPGLWHTSTDPPSFRDVLRLDHQVAPEVITPFVHLHAHSEFSPLDGLSRIHEMVEQAALDAQPALALTDHGVCAGHPELQALTRKAGIKPIFGLEAYLVNDRFERPEPKPQAKDYPDLNDEGFAEVIARWTIERDRVKDYYHLVLWAMSNVGLANVWAASTEAHRDGFYSHPRLDWDTLERYSEGVFASTACLRGPLSRPILREDPDRLIHNLGRLQGVFGDHLAVEIHTANLPEQRIVNEGLLSVAQERSLMTVAAVDSHYPCHHHRGVHKIWLAAQTNKELQDETGLFSGETDYHMMTAQETRAALDYLPTAAVDEAMANTLLVADQCHAEVKGETAMPIYSKQGGEQRDRERAVEICLGPAWKEKTEGKPHSQQVYMDRFEKEARLLSMKGFWGYYLIVWDYVRYARENRILVGPGRGSGGGSLIAYLMGIVGIDPVESGLIFERFLTEGRDSPPDFDIDFPTSKRAAMTAYVTKKYGSDSVVRVGVHTRLKNKGVIENLFRVLRNAGMDLDFKDQKKLSEIITRAEAHTAGLGLSWEALWDQHGDQLNPFREKYPELFGYADVLVGRLKSYGRHAAGLVIASDRTLADRFPMRMAGDKDNRQLVSDFPMDAMELLGLLKFDFLTLRTLDTIQVCVDMVEEQTSRYIDVDGWREEYGDPQVWSEVAAGKTLGIFQIETVAGTRLTREFGPQNISDLADVITLVRPGPKNSGLTDTYLRRRAGREVVAYPDSRLEETLGRTQGCIIYQEQIMNACSLLAGYTLEEADTVRRILGKKKVDAVVAEGQKFLPACIERGMTQGAATMLWAQMAEFAKYCLTGDGMVALAARGPHSTGEVSVADLYRRIHHPLRDPVRGRRTAGDEFSGPCDCCGADETSLRWVRGRCNACYVWRQKFLDPDRGLYGLAAHSDGRIRPARILDVVEAGRQEVWRITLAGGATITATANHRHLTPDGLVRVDALAPGDALVTSGGYEDHRYEPGEYILGPGGFTLLMAWTAQAPEVCEECEHDGSVHRLERAHVDGDRSNNEWSNLRMLCVSCHKRLDYSTNDRRRRWVKGRLCGEDKILSIEPMGIQPTYSVVMDDPHNLMVNGIITANSFNRSHAWGYAVLGFWTAWLKFHYPAQFLAAALSTVDQERIPEFIAECRRQGYAVLPPDVNESASGFVRGADGLSVRYGLEGVKGVGGPTADAVIEGQPYTSFEDFVSRKVVNIGVTRVLASIGAFDNMVPNRRALEARLEWEASKDSTHCTMRDENVSVTENNLPCTFDWSTEPVVIGKSGRPLKGKPPPKKCSRACRQYVAPTPPEPSRDYTAAEIRDREMELLGVWLSSTPFDDLPEEVLSQLMSAEEVEDGPPDNDYPVAAYIVSVRPTKDRYGKDMGFVSLNAQNGLLDAVVFKDAWSKYGHLLKAGRLVFAMLRKDNRSLRVDAVAPVPA